MGMVDCLHFVDSESGLNLINNSCECIEKSGADTRQGVVLQLDVLL